MKFKSIFFVFCIVIFLVLIFIYSIISVKSEPSVESAVYKVYLTFNETYVEKTKEDRLFRPKEITPFENIVCELKTNAPGVSVIGERGEIAGKLIAVENGKEIIVKQGIVKKTHLTVNEGGEKFYIYRWYINGWPDGITQDQELMEKVIENQNLKCVVGGCGPGGCEGDLVHDLVVEGEKIKTSNCVHLWGPDDSDLNYGLPFKVFYIRGKSLDTSPFWFVTNRIRDYEEGFHKIDPFAQFPEKFSHYLDLKEYNDMYWKEGPEKMPEDLSCKGIPRLSVHYSTSSPVSLGFVFFTSKKKIYLNPLLCSKVGRKPSYVLMHEVGHAFCHLVDEYEYHFGGQVEIPESVIFPLLPNCAQFPYWDEYGDDFWKGCLIHGTPVTAKNFYRPSKLSIMNELKTTTPIPKDSKKFNVVSCGYCLKEIKEDLSPTISNWKECCNMDTVKPTGGCPS